MFIGRIEESKKLNDFFKDEKSRLCAVFGRRRVGKSELINHCLEKSDSKKVYFECKQTTEKNNVNSITELICETFNYPSFSFESFEKLLKFMYELGEKEKIILVLDEYPYLREVVIGIDSIIQGMVDKYKNSKTKLVLCGSYIDVMKTLLEEENPLYGRIDLTLEVKPMDYLDSSLFYPSFSNADKVRLFSVFGGIPYYNKLIDCKKSVRENIIDLISSDSARLENEISSYLKSQLSKINNANEAIEIIARGYSKYKDIYEQAGVEKAPTLISALDKLVSMEIVKRVSPINDEANKKKTRYIISDQLSHFYYKYIYKNKSRIKMMDSNAFYDRFIDDDFETQYVPKSFEEVAKEYLIRQNKKGLLSPPFDMIGKYYYDNPIEHLNGEFDIVTHDEMGYVFYEVKFKNKPITMRMVDDEIEQIKKCEIKSNRFGFISRSGFDFSSESLILISLDDIYDYDK